MEPISNWAAHRTHTGTAPGVCVCVCVCVCACVCLRAFVRHKVQFGDKEPSGRRGGRRGIAKVNVALGVIYWHTTRLTPLMCV